MNEAVDYYLRSGLDYDEAVAQAILDSKPPGTYDVILRSNATGMDYSIHDNLRPETYNDKWPQIKEALDDYMQTLPRTGDYND